MKKTRLTLLIMLITWHLNYAQDLDARAVKVKLLRQQTGSKNIPVTVSVYSAIFIKSLKWEEPDRENLFSSRL